MAHFRIVMQIIIDACLETAYAVQDTVMCSLLGHPGEGSYTPSAHERHSWSHPTYDIIEACGARKVRTQPKKEGHICF
eukprot:1175302-Amphidinium_carterae.1